MVPEKISVVGQKSAAFAFFGLKMDSLVVDVMRSKPIKI
jgi:hypothetical protein